MYLYRLQQSVILGICNNNSYISCHAKEQTEQAVTAYQDI